jgi:hypothetical protein
VAEGQDDLIDRPTPDQKVPHAALETVVDWLSRTIGGEPGGVTLPPTVTGARVTGARVTGDRDAPALTERVVSLGPTALFGIETVSEGAATPGAPVVLLMSVANEHHIGPNRLWVDLAREWAAAGLRCVRMDFSGLGDSPVRAGQPEQVMRSVYAFDDVAEAAAAVSPGDPSGVALVGLCSSAYQAIESGLELRARAIYAINPVLLFHPPEMDHGRVDPRRQVCIPRTATMAAFRGNGPLFELKRRFPHLAWRVRNALSARTGPSRWLRRLADSDTASLFVCGVPEARPLLAAGRGGVDRFEQMGDFELDVISGLDHGLTIASLRLTAAERVTRHILARFGPGGKALEGPGHAGSMSE